MKYLRLFDTEAEYTAATLDYPNVAYVKGTDEVIMKGDPLKEYLNFTATSGDATIGMSGSATPNVSYSFDKNTWTTWDYSDITIPNGSTLYVKGTNTTMQNKKFTMSGSIAANGNVMSLLYGDNFFGQLTIPNSYCFNQLFYNCTGLTTAPQLPATTLAQNCYRNMFNGCSYLEEAPQLPATTLENYCYGSMFYGCTSLTSAPELPATTLTQNCYESMFYNCTSLTTAPTTLPATTLAMACCQYMFYGCTSLTTAPQLPATTLIRTCYEGMFQGCRNLNYIKMMATDISANSCLDYWVQGVQTTSGTFVKNSAAEWDVSGFNGVPNNWTIEYADA